ncbi:IS481 family transposase [Novispirillum itersonii]|uniref:Transposase InsO family protein n=1 Tax=Novispirillum itersonii TaxID=189 RepID=A0A7X0DKT6_NOVIT|nr:IS481 family transposase [Novispirillum itersonii]MBB6209265.1 transposase InsO family protein [Novispirillum itersonii]
MTTEKKVARRKLSLLELAQELGNVSRACKVMGYSRQQFYEIRRNYQTYGADGLIDRIPGARGPHPNRVAAEIEQAILSHALDHPCHGPVRVAQELALRGLQVSSGGVRGVWMRHKLLSRHDRLLRLEKSTADRKISLTDEQIRALERFSPEFRERHIEAPHTGALVAVDTFMVGSLKGVGKVYLQTVVDCHSRYAWGRLFTTKLPITAVQTLNNEVLPTFEEHNARIDAVLSDNGREFCGRPDQHPYELFLQLEGIEHKRTKVSRPQSNRIVERLHRTLLDEHFRVEGRKTWFETVDEMQTALDTYLIHYNQRRPHQGRGMNGRTPISAFIQGIPKRGQEGDQKTPSATTKPTAA